MCVCVCVFREMITALKIETKEMTEVEKGDKYISK